VTAKDDFQYYAERYRLHAGVVEASSPRATLDAVGGTAGLDSYEALLRSDTDVLERALSASSGAVPPNGPGH
jgi:hypothetical protein